MGNIRGYKDLDVWKKGMEVVKEVYTVTQKFPREEKYGLTNQVRRAATSIVSNIAEGKMRQYTNEYVQFLYVALGSCAEVDTQMTIAEELGYIDRGTNSKLLEEIDHIARMLRNLIKGIKK